MEEGMDSLFREWEREHADSFREEGVSNFEYERTASYFRSFEFDPLILKRMEEARIIRTISPTASLILNYSCIEFMLTKELFTPIVYAFTASNSIAGYFAKHIVGFGMPPRHIGEIVDAFLEMIIQTDTKKVEIFGETKNLWKYLESKKKIRNNAVHTPLDITEKESKEMEELTLFILKKICRPLRKELMNWK